MALDQQLRDLMDAHDLTSVSVGIIRSGDRWLANVSAQGGGECVSGGDYGEALTKALSRCIHDLSVRRSSAAALPDLEAVA